MLIAKKTNLFDAKEWIVDPDKCRTPLNLNRKLAAELSKLIEFKSKDGTMSYKFVTDTELDNQTTRGIRELTPASAALLDRIVEITYARSKKKAWSS